MPMERLLASTAIEESWGESEPVLFLGEWCRIYSRRHKWEALDAVVAPYHWADRTKVDGDRVYLWELHERLLVDLAARFNEIHGVEHGIQYWRILVGPWLGYFTQALFDRWEQIQSAISSFDVSQFPLPTTQDTGTNPGGASPLSSSSFITAGGGLTQPGAPPHRRPGA